MKWFKWIMLILFVVFGIPIFLEFFIFRNAFPSVLNNGEWAAFLGSYLGGVVSLIGIYLTIRFTQAENKKERELMYRPHIRVDSCKPDANFSNIIVSTKKDGSHVQDGKKCDIGIRIKNVGLGPVLNFSISDFTYTHKQTGEKVHPIEIGVQDIFESGETIQLWFEFNLDIRDSELEGLSADDMLKIVPFLSKGGDFSFRIKGNDVCKNPVDKEILIRVHTQIIEDENKKLIYAPYTSMC